MTELFVRDLLAPRPGREGDLAAAISELAVAEFAAARQHGALDFTLRREERGDRWLLEERWTDRAAFEAFHAGERPRELVDFLARADELLAMPLDQAVSFWAPAPEDRAAAERRLVEGVFERIAALDVDGLMALFGEDGRQAMPYAPPGFPASFDGKAELDRNYRTLLKGYASVRFDDLAIVALADAGRWLATYRTDIGFKDGRRYRNRYVALFVVEGGAIREWIEYFDPETLTRELGNPFAGGADAGSAEPANVRAVRAYLDRLAGLDIEAWGTLLAPDAVQENPFSPPGFPKTFEGWDAIMEHHRSLPGTFASMRFDGLVMHPSADPATVVAEFDGHIELKDGGRYDNRYISVFTFRDDGLIARVREYFNPLVLQSSFSGGTKLHGMS